MAYGAMTLSEAEIRAQIKANIEEAEKLFVKDTYTYIYKAAAQVKQEQDKQQKQPKEQFHIANILVTMMSAVDTLHRLRGPLLHVINTTLSKSEKEQCEEELQYVKELQDLLKSDMEVLEKMV